MRRQRIKRDESRFTDILKGKIKSDLKKYLKPGSVILPGKGKREPIRIRFFHLPLPKFRYGPSFGGVGTGKELARLRGTDPKGGRTRRAAGHHARVFSRWLCGPFEKGSNQGPHAQDQPDVAGQG